MPCNPIPEPLLKRARAQDVTIIDTLSKCDGVVYNTMTWAKLGGELLYGTKIAPATSAKFLELCRGL